MISRTSRSAGIPVLRSTSTTSSTKSGLASCWAAMFTAIDGWCQSLCMPAPARHASRSTQLPERHDQAALLGDRDELQRAAAGRASGWFQRTSASKPVIRCVSRSTVGW